jgi:hypothetical protein
LAHFGHKGKIPWKFQPKVLVELVQIMRFLKNFEVIFALKIVQTAFVRKKKVIYACKFLLKLIKFKLPKLNKLKDLFKTNKRK